MSTASGLININKRITIEPIFGDVNLVKSYTYNTNFITVGSTGTLNLYNNMDEFGYETYYLTIKNNTVNGQTTAQASLVYVTPGGTLTVFGATPSAALATVAFENGCGRNGGAIYTPYSSTTTTITLTNAYFNNCRVATTSTIAYNNGSTSFNRGGAIDANCANLTIDTCWFYNNYAVWGGAVYSDSRTPVIKNSYLSGNKAIGRLENGSGYARGGAIEGYFESSGNTYYNNSAEYGGAAYEIKSSTNDEFKNNSATSNGGAICYVGIINSGTTFISNTAGAKGGAVYQPNKIVGNTDIHDVQFEKNSALYGGAISGSGLNITGAYFLSNYSTKGGGAIYGTGSFTYTYFVNNYVTYTIAGDDACWGKGGAIWANAGTTTIDNCYFSGNTATYVGGAIYQYSYSTSQILTVTNSTILNNKSYGGGAGIFMNNGTVSGCTISSNTTYEMSHTSSAGNGSAIYINEASGTVTISDNQIKSNYCNSLMGVGAIYAEVNKRGVTSITNNTFSGNYNDIIGVDSIDKHIESASAGEFASLTGNTYSD